MDFKSAWKKKNQFEPRQKSTADTKEALNAGARNKYVRITQPETMLTGEAAHHV